MIRFKIKIADVVFEVSSNYPSTRSFYYDFLCDQPADHRIIIGTNETMELNNEAPHLDLERCERGILKSSLDEILVNYNTFPILASAISYRGFAYVFSALSGVGKSTHSRSWKHTFGDEVIIINDDRPYLKVNENGVWTYSHPQSGIHNLYTNTFSQVKAIGKIVRDSTNYVVPADGASFFPFLFQQTFTMNKPLLTSKIIFLLKQVIQRVELYEIHCNEDTDAAFSIQKQLSELEKNNVRNKSHNTCL